MEDIIKRTFAPADVSDDGPSGLIVYVGQKSECVRRLVFLPPPFALLRPSFADPGFGEAVSFTAGSGDEAPSIISLNLLPAFFFFCVFLFRFVAQVENEGK